MPGLGVVISNQGAQKVRRTRELLTDGNDNLRLIILRRSPISATATQFGRDITIDSGGAVVLSNSEQNSIIFPSPLRMLVLNLRRQMLRPLLRDFDAAIARPIPGHIEARKQVLQCVAASSPPTCQIWVQERLPSKAGIYAHRPLATALET
jgi:hypothetical protein